MRSFIELQNLFKEYMQQQLFERKPAELYEPLSYMLSIGGKRMRPLLVLMAAELFEKDAKDFLPQAFAIELFHNFTLVHDDIMDNAHLRRNSKTVHVKYNQNTAILSGDVMLVYAYEYLIKNQPSNIFSIIEIFNQTAKEVCEGQQEDMNFENRNEVSIDDYIRMIEMKTAVLLGAALKIGALAAKASSKDQNHLYEFGKSTGIAFQLSDDILDSFGETEKFGKRKGGDILQNKKTILMIEALNHATKSQKESLQYWFEQKQFTAEEKINSVLQLYVETGAEKAARELMKKYHRDALNHLDAVKVNASNKKHLFEFAEMLLERSI